MTGLAPLSPPRPAGEPAATKVLRFLREAPPPDPGRRPAAAASRVALGTALDLAGLPAPPFAAVEVLWFDGDAPEAAVAVEPGDGSVAMVVNELVLRGAGALAARWGEGGARFKMMSFGRRNPALSRDAFAERWRADAGRLGADPIPDELRGLAYVQDHPTGDDPAFDAVNEVWFDHLDGLRRRAEWFAARPPPAELMSPDECWSLYLREIVLSGPQRPGR